MSLKTTSSSSSSDNSDSSSITAFSPILPPVLCFRFALSSSSKLESGKNPFFVYFRPRFCQWQTRDKRNNIKIKTRTHDAINAKKTTPDILITPDRSSENDISVDFDSTLISKFCGLYPLACAVILYEPGVNTRQKSPKSEVVVRKSLPFIWILAPCNAFFDVRS